MSDPASRLRAMQEAFDRSFAEAPLVGATASVDLLLVGAGEVRCALRIAELRGLLAHREIAPLPTPARAVLGLAGIRGALFTVYDLFARLGLANAETTPYLALCAGEEGAALAFPSLHGFARASPHELIPGGAALTPSLWRGRGLTWPVASVPALLRGEGA